VRWKPVPQTSGCNRKTLSQTVDRRVGYVERPETLMRQNRTQNVVVVLLECLLVLSNIILQPPRLLEEPSLCNEAIERGGDLCSTTNSQAN